MGAGEEKYSQHQLFKAKSTTDFYFTAGEALSEELEPLNGKTIPN